MYGILIPLCGTLFLLAGLTKEELQMTGQAISHYKILEKLVEVRLSGKAGGRDPVPTHFS